MVTALEGEPNLIVPRIPHSCRKACPLPSIGCFGDGGSGVNKEGVNDTLAASLIETLQKQ